MSPSGGIGQAHSSIATSIFDNVVANGNIVFSGALQFGVSVGSHGSVQLMFAIWRRAVAPVVRGAHNFLDWRGLAWLIEVRSLANGSEGLGGQAGWALSIKVKGSCR